MLNVAVGYELSRAAVVEVRYVGSKGSNLDTSLTNFNSPDPDPNAGAVPLVECCRGFEAWTH